MKMNIALLNGKKRILGLVTLMSALSLLQGCSMVLGDEEFSCPNAKNGMPCTSTWDMYEATNNGQKPKVRNSNTDDDDEDDEESAQKKQQQDDNGEPKNGQSDFVLDNYVTARFPTEPIPVRTPPQVMRIWVAPYEDKEGDFIMSGYVYTEVSPRRWTLGVNSQDIHNQNVITPLQK